MEKFRSGTFEVLIHDNKVYQRLEYNDDDEFPYVWRVVTNDGLVLVDDEMEKLEQAYKKSFSIQSDMSKTEDIFKEVWDELPEEQKELFRRAKPHQLIMAFTLTLLNPLNWFRLIFAGFYGAISGMINYFAKKK
jgi:hypothetical protein